MPSGYMSQWTTIVAVYFAYLAAMAMLRPIGMARRALALGIAAGTLVTVFVVERVGSSWFLADVALPGLALLVGYWASALVARPANTAVEQCLLRVDRSVAGLLRVERWQPPRMLLELVEFAYLLVYPMLPAGAVLLWASGAVAGTLDRYWWLAIGSGFACYAVLPWLTTRPPRVLEDAAAYGGRQVTVRALNMTLLEHGSHARATIPSGHVATAVAAAIGIAPAGPEYLAGYLVLAGLIAIATVWGRYHYSVDTIAGLFVPFLFL